jgi:hypothetical protein
MPILFSADGITYLGFFISYAMLWLFYSARMGIMYPVFIPYAISATPISFSADGVRNGYVLRFLIFILEFIFEIVFRTDTPGYIKYR